jgi:ABC-type cobalamin/Fe3+-siderophores transport system ATPase subunit
VYAPAFITGTSSEFMGRKPLPRVLRQRRITFVLGPEGVGKSTVARALSSGTPPLEIDAKQLETQFNARIRSGSWSARILSAPFVVLDGPVWLSSFSARKDFLAELVRNRAAASLKTFVCQARNDASVATLLEAVEPGSAVTLGLRFPVGRRARLRCALALCETLGLPPECAFGSEDLEPWRYDRVQAFLVEQLPWRRP